MSEKSLTVKEKKILEETLYMINMALSLSIKPRYLAINNLQYQVLLKRYNRKKIDHVQNYPIKVIYH